LRSAIEVAEARRTKADLALQKGRQEAQNVALSLNAEALRISEQQLRASELHLERAQAMAGIGSWEFDVSTRRLTWSKEMYRIRGIDAENYVPTLENLPAWVHPDDLAAMQTWIAQLLAGVEVAACDSRFVRPDGEVRLVRVDAQKVMDADGIIRRYAGTVQDVTHRRQIELQLAQAQRMDALGNLTGGIAHDFNNMLGVIIGNLELQQRLLKDHAAAAELCAEALNGANRGADLIRRLLAFARHQALHPEPTDVNTLIRDITRMFRRTLGEDITLALDLDPLLTEAIVDPVQLESALVNLVTNARDAMPTGGKLEIATHNVQLDAFYVVLNPDVQIGDYVLIEVRDTGSGIPPDVIGRIFEPFFTTKRPGKGTGLGLAMAFGFIKQSGGHLAVYSEPRNGTTFRLYLPRSDAPSEVSAVTSTIGVVVGGDETVLIVEDNAQLRRAATRHLTDLGYHVREAQHADAALAMLAGGEGTDLLFADVVMQGTIDGFDLARQATSLRPGIRVLLTSGLLSVQEAEPNGADGLFKILNKPYSRDALARAVRATLDQAVLDRRG
jgi:PAS domain S-box-containing protein